MIPAYQELADSLESLRGTGKSSRGLAFFEGGREYYLYLLQSQTGTYVPVGQIEKKAVSSAFVRLSGDIFPAETEFLPDRQAESMFR